MQMVGIVVVVAIPDASVSAFQSGCARERTLEFRDFHVAGFVGFMSAVQLGAHRRGAFVFFGDYVAFEAVLVSTAQDAADYVIARAAIQEAVFAADVLRILAE